MLVDRLVLAAAGVLACAAFGACGGDGDGASERAATPPSTEVDSGAQRVEVAGEGALVWGKGRYGVVLAHGAAFDAASWEAQATRIAAQRMVALAVEDIAPEAIVAAGRYLMRERGVDDVALVGGSAGADAILELASREPGFPDQLILLSANQAVDGLGPEPKLFIASEDEPVADVSRQLAERAPGDENEAQILAGDAHAQNIFDTDQAEDVTRAILERLERFSRK